MGSVWSLDCGLWIFCTHNQLLLVTSLKVLSDICQVLELPAAHIAGIQIGAVHFALVLEKVFIHPRRKITPWKVASEWAKGNVPVLDCVLLEVSGRGESLLTTPEDAFEHARGICLVCLKEWSVSFEYLAAELALKLISIDFRLILVENERFVIDGQMLFEIGDRSESLLAVVHCALDDSWLSSLVALHVPLKICRQIKAFATQLAAKQKNGVHISHMPVQITL
jgi:hypothetical protein